MGGEGASLEAALAYSNVVFAGNVLVWLMNALASVIRGTGNMLVPSLAICAGVVVLVPLSPLLIFGLGPLPALGIAGGGVALWCSRTALTARCWPGTSCPAAASCGLRLARLRWALFRRHPARRRGRRGQHAADHADRGADDRAWSAPPAGPEAVAGYGTGGRLEYLLIPLVFGLGAPLVALVGTNIGAGQRDAGAAHRADRRRGRLRAHRGRRPRRGGLAAGLARPVQHRPAVLATGAAYLRIVGPTYGFFGLGLALYFASQGAGRLFWPLSAGFLRMLVAIGGGWLALRATGSLLWLFAALALGLFLHGITLLVAIGSGAWFRRPAPGPAAVVS